jgi:glycosyltransferase involved in cell wall biosynthesis
MDKKILSICVTSYNRPRQLERCLRSIKTSEPDSIELVVSEDCSPSKDEITEVVQRFAETAAFAVRVNVNPINLGYDRNFHSAISLAEGEHILFITDDDAILAGAVDALLKQLRTSHVDAAFTPYFDRSEGVYKRKAKETYAIASGIHAAADHLYDSILLSGLVFRKSAVPEYDPQQFVGLIYSQVFVFICILYERGGHYLDVPLVDYVGDGENGFGKNEGEKKNELLADRKHYLSNLEYNKRLLAVVRHFDARYEERLFDFFSREYSLRSVTGMSYAVSFGRAALSDYWIALRQTGVRLSALPYIYYGLLMLLGTNCTPRVIGVPRRLFMFVRQLRK